MAEKDKWGKLDGNAGGRILGLIEKKIALYSRRNSI